LPQRVLVPAGAGGFRVQKSMFPQRKDFMDLTGNVGTEDTARVKEKEDEMNKAAAKATERINKQDEAQIKDRIESVGGKKKQDSAFKAAAESGEGNVHSKDNANRQYEKWTSRVEKTGEPAYDHIDNAIESGREKGQEWAKKAEHPKERGYVGSKNTVEDVKPTSEAAKEKVGDAVGAAKGFVDKVKEKVEEVFGDKKK